MVNGFFYAAAGGVLGALFSAAAGYALAKYAFRGRATLFTSF
jgi:multiple sugar transport system permease protein